MNSPMLLTTGAILMAGTFLIGPSSAQSPDTTKSVAPSATDSAAAGLMRPNWFYYMDGDRLVRIDATPNESRASIGAGDVGAAMLWGGGGKTWMVMDGETSEVQIQEPQPRFRAACERVAALTVRLSAFQIKKGKRWAQTDAGRVRDFFKKPIELDVTKVADGLYEFKPKKPLPPGEYGLAAAAGGDVTDFTVVGSSTKGSEK